MRRRLRPGTWNHKAELGFCTMALASWIARLARKGLLAVAAVTDVALNARNGPVSGKALTKHHHLPSRHLEPELQALVREGILKGVRGPHGGYMLAREQ